MVYLQHQRGMDINRKWATTYNVPATLVLICVMLPGKNFVTQSLLSWGWGFCQGECCLLWSHGGQLVAGFLREGMWNQGWIHSTTFLIIGTGYMACNYAGNKSYLPPIGFAAAIILHRAWRDVMIPAFDILILCSSMASWIHTLEESEENYIFIR